MGLFGSLFGKKPKQVIQPTGFETLPEEVQQAFLGQLEAAQGLPSDIFAPTPLTGAQQGALTQLQQPFQFGPGEQEALTALQNLPGLPSFGFGQQAAQQFGAAGDVLGRAPGQVDLANQAVQRAVGGISRGTAPITGEQLQQGISEFLNPFTGEVIAGAARDIREQGRGIFADIGAGATGAGAFGGTRQATIESQLGGNIAREIGDVSGRLRSQGFQQASQQALSRLTGERGRELQGAQLQLGGGQLGLGGAQALTGIGGQLGQLGSRLFGAREGARGLRLGSAQAALGAGQLQRQLPQEQLLRTLQLGEIPRGLQQQTQQAPLQQLQFLQGILGGFPGGGGQIGSGPQRPGALQRIGDASGGIASIAALFSDENLKDGIKFKRKEKGFNIYEFSYKGETKKYEGVIAQEVEKIQPDAVIEMFGIKAVYYDKLGLTMRRVA